MFSNLNKPLNITLTILVIAFGVYLLLLIMAVVFSLIFARHLRKDTKGLMVIITTKYGYLKRVYEIAEKIAGDLEPEIKEALNYFNLINLQDPTSNACRETVNKLTFLRNEMDFLPRKDVIYTKHEEFLRAKSSVEEMDVVYQRAITNYNNDISGYNYWIRFLPVRFIFLMFRIKTKDII